MITIEDMKRDMEKDPELKENLHRQMEYFFPRWMEKKSKEDMIEKLPEEDKSVLFQFILTQHVTMEEIEQSRQSEAYNRIISLLQKVMSGEREILHEIEGIYQDHLSRTKKEYEKRISDFKYGKLPKAKRKQIDVLRAKQKDAIAESIMENYCKYGAEVKEVEEGYNSFCNLSGLLDVCRFTPEVLQANQGILPTLTAIICFPKFLVPVYVDERLNAQKELPGNWYLYRSLTIPEYKQLLAVKDDPRIWKELFDRVRTRILEKADIPVVPFKKRKELVESIFFNCENGYYDSAMILSFSAIEGLLWETAHQIHKKEQIFTDRKVLYDDRKKESFPSTRIRDAVERTAMRKYLDPRFIEEFCNELYEERNPVLHGNVICHIECSHQDICFIKKLFAMDYVMDVLLEIYQNQLFQEWDSSFSEAKIKEFLKKWRGLF